MMKQIFTIITIVIMCLGTASAQTSPQIIWQKTIGGFLMENFSIIYPTKDGGYIVGAASASTISGDKTDTSRGSNDYWVVKLNSIGAIQWQKTIGGNKLDNLKDIIPTYDGGYLLGGESQSDISGEKTEASRGLTDYWVVKINDTGKIMWQKTIGGTAMETMASIVQSPQDSGYIIAGTSSSGVGGDKTNSSRGLADYWVVKLNKNGGILWNKSYGGDRSDNLADVVATQDGGFLLGGSSNSNISGEKTDTARKLFAGYWIVKINDTGKVQWDKTYGPPIITTLTSMYETSDNGFILGGYTSGYGVDKSEPSKGGQDYWIVKTDAMGAKLWDKTIGGVKQDQLYSVMQTSDGGYILGGESNSDSAYDKKEAPQGDKDYWCLKLNNVGTIEWQKTIGSAEADICKSFFATADGGFIIGGQASNSAVPTGDKTDPGWGNTDIWILKLRICPSNITAINTTFCRNEEYILPWGDTVTKSGTYNRPYPAAFTGCDSISSIVLTYKPVDTAVTVSGNTLTAHATTATGYQWVYCETGLPVAGATARSFTPEVEGSYAVSVTATTGCTETSSCYTVSSVGISHVNHLQSINIYPNPASTIINIGQNKDNHVQQIEIMDLLGKKVLSQAGGYVVDVSRLPSTTYIMHVRTSDGVLVKKITILK